MVRDALIGKSVYVKHNLIKQCSILPRALVNTGGLEAGPEEGHQACQVGRHKVLQVLGECWDHLRQDRRELQRGWRQSEGQTPAGGQVCYSLEYGLLGAGGKVQGPGMGV